MGNIVENVSGVKTALYESLKSSEGQTEKFPLSKNCVADSVLNSSCKDNLPLFSPSSLLETSGDEGLAEVKTQDITSETAKKEAETLVLGSGGAGNKKAGRPKGAKNRSTEEWRQYFFARISKSPLIMLGELYCKNTADLAREMSCDRIDALKTQVAAANAVLPYVHQKQPIAIESIGDNVPCIYINVSKADASILEQQSKELQSAAISIAQVTDAEFSEVLAEQSTL